MFSKGESNTISSMENKAGAKRRDVAEGDQVSPGDARATLKELSVIDPGLVAGESEESRTRTSYHPAYIGVMSILFGVCTGLIVWGTTWTFVPLAVLILVVAVYELRFRKRSVRLARRQDPFAVDPRVTRRSFAYLVPTWIILGAGTFTDENLVLSVLLGTLAAGLTLLAFVKGWLE